MKHITTTTLLSSLPLILPVFSTPVSTPHYTNHKPPGHLLGSSFGVPGPQTFDYVVIGGGTAGLALASRLSENPNWTVAVVEAGGFYETDNGNVSQVPLFASIGSDKTAANYNPLVDWGFMTEPQTGANNTSVHYARGKCLGGSSARNYMAYQRGTVESFDLWATLVGDKSYSWRSFLPYLQKSVHFTPPPAGKRAANATAAVDLKTIGPNNGPVSLTFSNYAMGISSYVQKGFAEIGIRPTNGFASGTLNGSSYVLETIDESTQIRESSETAFLTPALGRDNLIVFAHTLAKKVLFDSQKRATGVSVETGGKVYKLSAKNEVVLSAGAFQSPQLLMVSGVGPKATLDKFNIPLVKNLPGVGQNMWDHVFFGPSYKVNVITGSALARPGFAKKAVTDLLEKQSGILTNSGGDFFAWEKLPPTSRAALPDSDRKALASFPADWPELEYLTVGGYMGDNVDYTTGPSDGFNYATVVAALVAPLSRGTVSIRSNDTSDAPVIDPQWLTHPTDRAVAIAAQKRLRELFATKAMKGVVLGDRVYPPATKGGETDAQLLAEVGAGFNTVWHAACTCKMGKKEDEMAVVDGKARVFGVRGLRVVDASSFALLPPGHPVSAIYALAEKIADDIKKDPVVV
ncbi:hypothetical protein GMDG_04317 [Pseudogymnoascus destructans 20631-21]|uniref:Glucose-methanol-choline oxidoreductase N-terminal domain-containing protein n=1 Tax=Pseudogymnoascus destructans (strain ATCC MYA-4855 / 20631-21) TaxID=658429 RepID=L8GAB1_PSED2|nr:hypothetical protein GMDG_04317 [Pseudogymnoascus destructans 20631-21]